MKSIFLILCFCLSAASAEEIYYGDYPDFIAEECGGCCQDSFYISADYLYWTHDFGLPIGFTFSALNSSNLLVNETDTIVNASIKRPSNQWSSGVRLGAGCELGCNGWDLFLSWTSFFNKATFNSPTGLPINIAFTRAHSVFTYNYNLADFELGKVFDVGGDLYLRPFIGVRGAWIEEKVSLDLSGNFVSGVSPPLDMPFFAGIKHRSAGVGPRMGLDTSWGNFWGFSLVGNISGALVYSKPKEHYNIIVTNTNVTSTIVQLSLTDVTVSDSYWQLIPNVQLLAGISGRWDFDCLGGSLNFFAGWESTYWWEETKLIVVEQSSSLEGLTVSLAYSF